MPSLLAIYFSIMGTLPLSAIHSKMRADKHSGRTRIWFFRALCLALGKNANPIHWRESTILGVADGWEETEGFLRWAWVNCDDQKNTGTRFSWQRVNLLTIGKFMMWVPFTLKSRLKNIYKISSSNGGYFSDLGGVGLSCASSWTWFPLLSILLHFIFFPSALLFHFLYFPLLLLPSLSFSFSAISFHLGTTGDYGVYIKSKILTSKGLQYK